MTTVTIDHARKINGAKIAAVTGDNRVFILCHAFAGRDDDRLVQTIHKINAARQIDTRYWRPARKGEF